MSKNKKGLSTGGATPTSRKKRPDLVKQKLTKLRKVLKSSGKSKFFDYLEQNPEVKASFPDEVKALEQKATAKKSKSSSFGTLKNLQEAYRADPEGTMAKVMGDKQ